MDNVTIRQCSHVIVIMEDDSVDNDDGRDQLSDIYFTNFSIYDNEGAVLYHSYPSTARAYITWENVNWTSNIQDTSGVSSSTAMMFN